MWYEYWVIRVYIDSVLGRKVVSSVWNKQITKPDSKLQWVYAFQCYKINSFSVPQKSPHRHGLGHPK